MICYAFSAPASAFVSQVNRATSETLRLQATQEGLVPLKAWVKDALDHSSRSTSASPISNSSQVGDGAVGPLPACRTWAVRARGVGRAAGESGERNQAAMSFTR